MFVLIVIIIIFGSFNSVNQTFFEKLHPLLSHVEVCHNGPFIQRTFQPVTALKGTGEIDNINDGSVPLSVSGSDSHAQYQNLPYAIINVIEYACAFPTMTCQSECCIKVYCNDTATSSNLHLTVLLSNCCSSPTYNSS